MYLSQDFFVFIYLAGSEAVLGPAQPVTYQTTDSGLPLEQAVSRQRLRPGSGFLSVMIETDGPTRVLKVIDIKEKVNISKIIILF